jgi:hypothetical protein
MGRLLPMMVYFACGSVVRFVFSGTGGTLCHLFRKKHVPLRPAGGESAGCPGRRLVGNRPRNSGYVVVAPAGTFPPAGRKKLAFLTKMLHQVQHFCQKRSNVPCCRRRDQRSIESVSHLNAHCGNFVNYTSYAVTNSEGHVASGRAERGILFHKNVGLRATFL